jgi:hypothetical protein
MSPTILVDPSCNVKGVSSRAFADVPFRRRDPDTPIERRANGQDAEDWYRPAMLGTRRYSTFFLMTLANLRQPWRGLICLRPVEGFRRQAQSPVALRI